MNRTRVPVLLLLSGMASGAFVSAPAPVSGQAPDSPTNTLSLFAGGGTSSISGGPAEGGVAGLTVGGLALDRRLAGRLGLRAELVGWMTGADLGRTGLFELPTEISQSHLGLGVQLRHALGARGFVGVGGTVLTEIACDVDVEGGPGFLGGETVACADFEDEPLAPKSSLVAVLVSAGFRGGRLGFEARLDQALGASIESAEGDMTPRRISLVLHYVLRRWR